MHILIPSIQCFFKAPAADPLKRRRGEGKDQKEDMVLVCCPL
jgi:hypothetical protein